MTLILIQLRDDLDVQHEFTLRSIIQPRDTIMNLLLQLTTIPKGDVCSFEMLKRYLLKHEKLSTEPSLEKMVRVEVSQQLDLVIQTDLHKEPEYQGSVIEYLTKILPENFHQALVSIPHKGNQQIYTTADLINHINKLLTHGRDLMIVTPDDAQKPLNEAKRLIELMIESNLHPDNKTLLRREYSALSDSITALKTL